MANNYRCGGCGRRNSNNGYGCLNTLPARRRWDNYPYYEGPCPDGDGCYEADYESERNEGCECGGKRRRRRRSSGDFALFTAMLPMAVTANGIIPLVNNNCLCPPNGISANSGLIAIEEEGTYLATYTVRMPEGAQMASTFTLNVNDASQAPAVMQVGGAAPASFTAQAVFDVCDHATVTLRSSEAINITETSIQPLVTMTLVKI